LNETGTSLRGNISKPALIKDFSQKKKSLTTAGTSLAIILLEAALETQRINQNIGPNQPSEPPKQIQAGITLANRYLIQGVIGIGGMGAVYRARDLHFPNVDKKVAVKEMVNQAADLKIRETITRNFEREANILATLSHPAIPRIYDYFTHESRSYLILEFVEGKDLEAIISSSEEFFSEQQVIGWGIELCDVLSYLHNHAPEPIIFRDMKPSNVMINTSGHVVLVDFGIAKPFESGARGTMIGTEGYSPPEQYRGEATPLADIYSLGATLHHLLTRRDPRLEPPFSFGERPVRGINPNVSVELESIIFTALKYNPSDRFDSAASMKEALVGAACKSGMLSHLHVRDGIRSPETVKVIWTFECEDELRGSPTCSQGMLYAGSYDHNLYALDASTGAFIWKYAAAGGIVSKPAIIENSLYFGSEDQRLYVVNAKTGKLNWSYYTEGPIRSSPLIVENHVFIGSDDEHLHAVNIFHGRPTWRGNFGASIRSRPCLLNDRIFFGTESGDFFCIDLTGEIRWRFKAKRAITSTALAYEGVLFFTSVDATLYALDATSGWVIWRFRLGKPSISSPCLAENFVFAGSSDGNMYCVDIRSAKEVWRFNTGHQVNSSPVVHKDSLYFGSVDGHLYCLEYQSGRLRWKFRTEGPITGSPVVENDIIYINSTDHKIYALEA
jgi:eukaryotic-like serine/threonine-protein kinase